jgi:hypothetical protein
MLTRLRAFFNPPDPAQLPWRIFWTGFLIRVLYMTLAHTYRMRVLDDHFEFGWEMGRIARALVTGHGFANPFNGNSGPTAWTPPLYPLIIALAFKLFGVYTLKSAWFILMVNSIFSASTGWAVYEMGWRCFGRDARGLSIARWSGWLWALYPAAMQYAVKWVWDMALTAFLFSWVIILALRLRGVGEPTAEPSVRKGATNTRPLFNSQRIVASLIGAAALWYVMSLSPDAVENVVLWLFLAAIAAFVIGFIVVLLLRMRPVREPAAAELTARQWLLFGLLWGLIALSNSSLLTFLPFCGLWIIWPSLRSWLPGAPSRPHRMSGVRVLLGPILAAVVFAAVVSPWILRNWYAFHAFVPMRSNFGAELYEATTFSNDGFPWMATLPLAETAPEFVRYERMGEIAYSKQQGERAKDRIRAHPGLFVRNALMRVDFFWVSVPHPLDAGVFVEATRRFNFAFLSFSGFLGLALAIRRHIPGAWLFFWAFAVVPFVYYFVTVQARFRHPLEPIICLLSVYLFQSADRSRTWSWRKTPSVTP